METFLIATPTIYNSTFNSVDSTNSTTTTTNYVHRDSTDWTEGTQCYGGRDTIYINNSPRRKRPTRVNKIEELVRIVLQHYTQRLKQPYLEDPGSMGESRWTPPCYKLHKRGRHRGWSGRNFKK